MTLSNKTAPVIFEIASHGVWYAEELGWRVFFGVISKSNGRMAVRAVIAPDEDAAEEALEEYGQVLVVMPLAQLLSQLQSETQSSNRLIL